MRAVGPNKIECDVLQIAFDEENGNDCAVLVDYVGGRDETNYHWYEEYELKYTP